MFDPGSPSCRAASQADVPVVSPLAVVLADRHVDGWHETGKQTVVYLDEGDVADVRRESDAARRRQHGSEDQAEARKPRSRTHPDTPVRV